MNKLWKDIKFGVKSIYKEPRKYKKLSKKLLREYYSSKDTKENAYKGVVFMCDGKIHHGGLADRLRAIISVYDFCKKNNIDFKLYFVSPFNLNDFLVPNFYDWTIHKDEISYSRKCSKPINFDCNLNIFEKAIHRCFLKSSIDKTKQNHVYSNTYCYEKKYSERFNELFQPTRNLSELVDYYINEIGTDYVSVSFRFCQLLGAFAEDVCETLPEDQQFQLMNRSKEIISSIYESHDIRYKILVTSDSNKFLDHIKDLEFVYIVPGKISHSNYEADDATHMKTFLDFFLISKAQKVYMAYNKIMYKGGFAKRASMINNVPFEAYFYE